MEDLSILHLVRSSERSNILEGFEIKGGVERDGVYFVIKGEKAKEAEAQVKEWLQKIQLIK